LVHLGNILHRWNIVGVLQLVHFLVGSIKDNQFGCYLVQYCWSIAIGLYFYGFQSTKQWRIFFRAIAPYIWIIWIGLLRPIFGSGLLRPIFGLTTNNYYTNIEVCLACCAIFQIIQTLNVDVL
jgi:hypothetical protein